MRRHIASHAAFRGVAACMVLAYHMQFDAGSMPITAAEKALTFLPRSYLAVDLFFILSGFIIAYTAAPNAQPLSRADVGRFYWARLTRIVPLHWFCFIAALLLKGSIALMEASRGRPFAWNPDSIAWGLQEFFLVNSWTLTKGQMLNDPDWSISAEMFAYLCFPVLIIVTRSLWGRGALLVASLGLFAYAGWAYHDLDIISGFAPLRCMAGFMLGMLLHHYRDVWTRVSDRLSSALQLSALAGIAIVMSFPLDDLLVIPCFALLVAASWTDRGVVGRFCQRPLLQFLGDISFPLYLTHWTIVLAVTYAFSHGVVRLGLAPLPYRLLWLACLWGLSFSAATLAHNWIELPFHRHFKRRKAAAQIAQSASLPSTTK